MLTAFCFTWDCLKRQVFSGLSRISYRYHFFSQHPCSLDQQTFCDFHRIV